MSFGFLVAAALAAQGGVATNSVQAPPVTVTPVPPPIVRTPPAPPMPVITPAPPAYLGDWSNRPTATVRVRARAGDTTLLEDSFRVGSSGANFSVNRSESVERSCSTTYPRSRRTSVNMTLRAEGGSANNYRLNFGWSRPTGDCGEGSLGVNVDQAVDLEPGETVVVQGDGGVRVELTRGR